MDYCIENVYLYGPKIRRFCLKTDAKMFIFSK